MKFTEEEGEDWEVAEGGRGRAPKQKSAAEGKINRSTKEKKRSLYEGKGKTRSMKLRPKNVPIMKITGKQELRKKKGPKNSCGSTKGKEDRDLKERIGSSPGSG